MRHLATMSMLLALAGCTNLPVSGPTHRDIERSATASVVAEPRAVAEDYVLVDITKAVLLEVPQIGPHSFFRSFGERRNSRATFKFGVGDLLQVTIFESSSGGLFTPIEGGLRPGNFVTLPSQVVSRNGTISIPFAGDVRVAGRTIGEVQKDIEQKLSGRAVEPQVVVTLGEQVGSSITVVGDTSSRLQLRGDERILDVVARAGGLRYPGYESFISLTRNGRTATVYFPALVRNPKENIFVMPGDTVYIHRQQQRFVAFGAIGVGGQTQGVTGFFPFEQEELSLTEAVAKVGGLADTRANSEVFVYRLEAKEALERMGVNVARFSDRLLVPTIYRANFRDPSVFFSAQGFPMRHKDALYVANSDSVELEKFLFHTRAITGTIAGVSGDITATRENFRALAR